MVKKIEKILLPRVVSDGRVDTLLKIFSVLTLDPQNRPNLILNWTRTDKVSPAGLAILACLSDTVIEQRARLKNVYVKKKLSNLSVIQTLIHSQDFKRLPDPKLYNTQTADAILQGLEFRLMPDFMDQVSWKFKKHLTEDVTYACRLLLNELMINSADHSTAERYYLYAGLWEGEFHVGVLDMGVTIPAKLERVIKNKDDIELLELALKEGVTTRRARVGGLGLSHTLATLKNEKGKLTILSRNAQIRRYFNRRSSYRAFLKFTLDGTWCFARFPIG